MSRNYNKLKNLPIQKRGPLPDRAKYKDYRVVQRDLVYIIGIPLDIASESILSKYEYFGQYGNLKKVYVNTTNSHSTNPNRPTVSAFVTFYNNQDALECIYSLENFVYNGYQIKASLGTSKYCTSFLCGQKCNNPECMYLHHFGEEEDSFSPEEISQFSSRFLETTRPSRPPDYLSSKFQDSRPTVFPFRRLPNTTENTDGDNFEEEDNQDDIEEEEEEINEPLSFAKSLLKTNPLTIPPLSINYTTNDSLTHMLGLDKPYIRSSFKLK